MDIIKKIDNDKVITNEFSPKYVGGSFYTSYRNQVSNLMFDIVENKRLCDSNNTFNDFDKIVYSFYEFEVIIHNIKFIDQFYEVNNKYYVSVDYLKKFIENSDYKYKDNINKLLDEYNSIYKNVKNMNIEDYITKRANIISQYDSISVSLSDYFEDYFIKNMPNEYREKVLDNYNFDIKI